MLYLYETNDDHGLFDTFYFFLDNAKNYEIKNEC